MSPQANSIGFLYLDQNGLLLFTTTTPSVLQYGFPLDVVRDLEVINKDLLQNEMKTILTTNNLQPTRYIMALSENVLFEKPFHDSKSPDTQREIQEFLDNMPFEHTATVIFENAESKLIATNKDLFQTLIKILDQEGSLVEYILPSYILGIDANQALTMSKERLLDIHRKASSFRQYSFLTDGGLERQTTPQDKARTPEKVAAIKEEKSSSKNLFVLLGVFIVLLLILGIVAFLSFRK